MGYLVLTRREGESLNISIRPGADVDDLVQDLLQHGITIGISELNGTQAKIGISAPDDLLILREELVE